MLQTVGSSVFYKQEKSSRSYALPRPRSIFVSMKDKANHPPRLTSREEEEKSVSTRTRVNRTPQQAADQNVEEMPSTDEREIRELIDQWAKAVRNENRDGIRADHDSEILMFDVPPPLFSRGLDAYM